MTVCPVCMNGRDPQCAWHGDVAMKAEMTAATTPATDELWKPASDEHKAIGWTYDYRETDEIREKAEIDCGFDATAEFTESVMKIAEQRFIARIHQEREKAIRECAELAALPVKHSDFQKALSDCDDASYGYANGRLASSKDILALLPTPPSAERSAWQPIETAPKDCDVILGIAHGDGWSHVSQGRWIEAEGDQSDQPGHDAGFVDCEYSAFFPGRSFGAEKSRYQGTHPTHWQPLPEAPKP